MGFAVLPRFALQAYPHQQAIRVVDVAPHPTLAESQWRAMEDARLRYLAMDSAIELAYETRRLAQVAFQNGQATSTDVADASLDYTKSSLARVQAAYEYVMALARLLGTAGDPDRLDALSRTATHLVDLTKE